MRRFIGVVVAAIAAIAVLGTQVAVAREGAQKAPLFGPNDHFLCPGGGEPTPATFGFVFLNTLGPNTPISGGVALKGADPNATYNVAVWEEDSITCEFVFNAGTITTNGQGNGSLNISVPREPGVTGAFVSVQETSGPFKNTEIDSNDVPLD